MSVVSLTTGLVTATIPGDNTSTVATLLGSSKLGGGDDRTPTGKVYVTQATAATLR